MAEDAVYSNVLEFLGRELLLKVVYKVYYCLCCVGFSFQEMDLGKAGSIINKRDVIPFSAQAFSREFA